MCRPYVCVRLVDYGGGDLCRRRGEESGVLLSVDVEAVAIYSCPDITNEDPNVHFTHHA